MRQIASKNLAKKTALLVVTVFACLWFAPGVALARPPAGVADAPAISDTESPANSAPASTSAQPSPIAETFDVNKVLKTDGQKSYVPTRQEANSATEDAPVGIAGVLLKAIDLFIKLIAAIALVVFVLGALLMIVSEGKSDMVEKGKSAMLYSIIGLVISMFAFIIVTFVQSILF